jgi:hypothetical protein
VVHDAHLFLLQFHSGSFVASWWGEMAVVFSAVQSEEAFHGLGIQDITEFDSD